MIKAVLFDYGGVLSEGGKTGAIQRIFGSIYGIDPSEMNEDVDVIAKVQRGTISGDDYLTEMNRRHPGERKATRENYQAASDVFTKRPAMYQLAERLRKNGIATGILSNINDLIAVPLRERGFYDGFNPVILSYQEKTGKPSTDFYQLAVERLGVAADEVLFVDDSPRYGPPAEALGMRFIQSVSAEQTVRDIEVLIQKENGITL